MRFTKQISKMIKLKNVALSAVGVLMIVGSGLIQATETRGAVPVTTIVYPTGAFPGDVATVQSALDRGGTVLLKATNAAGVPTAFNFGTPERLPGRRVLFTTDVNIVGERVGSHMTTVNGGFAPFRSLFPVKSRIEGIDFESPLSQAILIIASTGTEIVGNRINGVIPILVGNPVRRFFTFGDGIDLFGNRDPQHAITGKVRVADNVIENLTAQFATGIQLDAVAADSEITGNTINLGPTEHDVQGIGIVAIRSQSSVLIDNNTLGPDMAGAGIFISGDHNAAYQVSRNTVICESPFADGIDVTGGDFSEGTISPVIEKNHVTMHNSQFGGIVFYGLVSNGLVGENKIDGDGAVALVLAEGFVPGNLVSSNRLQGNNISLFTASLADVLFDTNTRDNVLVGHCDSIIDLGVNNSATCATPRNASLIGEQMKNEHARKSERLQRLMSIDRESLRDMFYPLADAGGSD